MPVKPPAPRVTHFVERDRRRRRFMRAICGELVHVSDESPRPTCADCQRELAASLEALDTLLKARP